MYVFIALVLMALWALHKFGIEKAKSEIRFQWISKTIPELKDYILPSIGVGLLSANWRDEFLKQSQLWRSQVWDFRRFLFSSSQGILSYFYVFLVLALFLEVSGFLVMIVSAILWLATENSWANKKTYLKTLGTLMFFGSALFFVEFSFKNSGLLMQYLLESELVFITTIDSNLNLLILLCISICFSYFFPVQGWSVVLTYLLYLNSQISYLGFVFVIVGELISMVLYWHIKIRSWDVFYGKKIRGLLIWALGYLVGILALFYGLTYFVRIGGTYNQLIYLKWIFIATVSLILAGLYIVIMAWGHFTIAKQDREMLITDSGLVGLTKDLTDPVSFFIVEQLKLRRVKLNEFKKELQQDSQSRGKIPPFVLSQFEAELTVIDKITP